MPLRLGSLEWGSIAVNLFGRVRDLETCIEVAGGTNIGCNCSKKDPSRCCLTASILCEAQHSSSGGRWHKIWNWKKKKSFFWNLEFFGNIEREFEFLYKVTFMQVCKVWSFSLIFIFLLGTMYFVFTQTCKHTGRFF